MFGQATSAKNNTVSCDIANKLLRRSTLLTYVYFLNILARLWNDLRLTNLIILPLRSCRFLLSRSWIALKPKQDAWKI